MSIVHQLPWVLVWVVVLLLQDRFIRKKNWFGSLILIWITLILSFVWDKAADLIISQGAETFHFGSRFWLLFVIIAILHCLGRRREKKQAAARKASVQPGGPDETPEVPASPENSDENREA